VSSKTCRLSLRLAQIWPELTKDQILARILCGDVRLNGETLRNPAQLVSCESILLFQPPKYVSRGGEKLDAALRAWNWDVIGKRILDVGASTGGFTDALLQAGAARVWSVDVGRGQLAASLVQDPRVINLEGHGIFDLPDLEAAPDGGVADISFRSLDTILVELIKKVREGWVIALVKPQFERKKYGDGRDDFHGVVDDGVGKEILMKFLEEMETLGIKAEKTLASPLRGRKGNQEYLVLFKKDGT